MSLTEPLLNNTHNESEANESEKVLQKRSDVSDAANHQNNCNFCFVLWLLLYFCAIVLFKIFNQLHVKQ